MTASTGVKYGVTMASRKLVWKIVARLGWCHLDEVRAEPDSPEESSLKKVLCELRSHGYLVSRKIPKERRRPVGPEGGSSPRIEYAVTPECLIPYGLTTKEVADALAIPLREPQDAVRALAPVKPIVTKPHRVPQPVVAAPRTPQVHPWRKTWKENP